MPDEHNVPALLATLDAEQARLREVLAGRDETKLAERRANGDWSVVEHVRHLIFAEQLHLGRFATEKWEWSPFGFAHDGLLAKERLRAVGTAKPANISEVLDAWQIVHELTRKLCRSENAELPQAIQNHLKHLRSHVVVIERQILRTGA